MSYPFLKYSQTQLKNKYEEMYVVCPLESVMLGYLLKLKRTILLKQKGLPEND